MPPLKNIKHEKFVRELIKSPTNTEAYQKVYDCTRDAARSSAPVVLADPSVRNRLIEVFEEQGINDDFVSSRLKHLSTSAQKESVQLGAIRTVLEVRKDIDSSSKIGIQINLDQEKKEKAITRLQRYRDIIGR